MGHENDGLGAMLFGVLDCWERADDALVVRDLLVGVQRDIEVNLVMDSN